MAYRVTLIPGDGTGPELARATKRVLEATGVKFDWDMQDAGVDVHAKEGTPLPDRVLASLRKNKVGLKGPITTPVGTGFRSVNVALRKELDLFACERPCKSYPGVRSRYTKVDLVRKEASREIREDSGISIKPVSVMGSERIVRHAFAYAKKNGRKKVTAVHKANIMKYSDGLFLEVARRVAGEFPEVAFNDRIVDNMCMQLVQVPEEYDVLVLPNLYGDIVSDLAAGLVGGLGMAPGANIGTDAALFEPTHGSAPKYAGQDRVNPLAMILSGMLMLRYLGEFDVAERLEGAIAAVISEGKKVTYDMKPERNDPTAVGTQAAADAIIEAFRRI